MVTNIISLLMDGNSTGDYTNAILFVLAGLFVMLCALPFHEFAHAFTANKLGDPTAKNLGRLTVNPFAHLDPIGSLSILILGFGWAKPVPINMRNFRSPKRGMAISAAAGPVSNVIIAALSLLLLHLVLLLFYGRTLSPNALRYLGYLLTFLIFAVSINVALAVFNLIPLPPLDGSRILSAFLPDRYYYQLMRYESYIMIIVLVLAFTGGLFFLSPLISGVIKGLNWFVSLPFPSHNWFIPGLS